MWNIPSKERLDRIPKLYEDESIPLRDKSIYLHFFLSDCDWYIAEYDGENLFWGYAILNGNLQNAEWGYISFSELRELRVDGWMEAECETEETWVIRKAAEVEKIKS